MTYTQLIGGHEMAAKYYQQPADVMNLQTGYSNYMWWMDDDGGWSPYRGPDLKVIITLHTVKGLTLSGGLWS